MSHVVLLTTHPEARGEPYVDYIYSCLHTMGCGVDAALATPSTRPSSCSTDESLTQSHLQASRMFHPSFTCLRRLILVVVCHCLQDSHAAGGTARDPGHRDGDGDAVRGN